MRDFISTTVSASNFEVSHLYSTRSSVGDFSHDLYFDVSVMVDGIERPLYVTYFRVDFGNAFSFCDQSVDGEVVSILMDDWESPETKECFLKRLDFTELEKVQFEQVAMDLHDLLRHVGSLIEQEEDRLTALDEYGKLEFDDSMED